MNSEILNSIFSYITLEQNKKRNPIEDIIDKKNYKLIIFSGASCDIQHHIEYKMLNTEELKKEFSINCFNAGYMTYNNKRRWTFIIYKQPLNITSELLLESVIRDLLFKKITNNKITKYEQKEYIKELKYIDENLQFML